ncbi:AraC family transcriptional regulator [Gracilibacillus phocaeensis]|uniref:AraC family transcriptional regulator n=1 Tax=Gracilibacillus phocaeensis TaxID=2042304 RepID=UPI00102F4524|nr:AraC family transcriptional regulator [Gracilibacillus phocaeensis]
MFHFYSCRIRERGHYLTVKRKEASSDFLLFLTKGDFHFRIENQVHTLQEGDILFIPRGKTIQVPARTYHQKYTLEFGVLDKETKQLPILANQQIYKIKIQNTEYFKRRFALLRHHWMSKEPYRKTLCSAILLEMLSIANYDLECMNKRSKKKDMVSDIKKYIGEHYQEPIKLQDLSDLCGKTPNYISYIFKEVTGYSPVEYIQEVRISAATDLMLLHGMSITEVSERLGFCDQAYFYRVFKKVTGCSPTRFLNEQSHSRVREVIK